MGDTSECHQVVIVSMCCTEFSCLAQHLTAHTGVEMLNLATKRRYKSNSELTDTPREELGVGCPATPNELFVPGLFSLTGVVCMCALLF